MNRAVASQFRRAGVEPVPGRPTFASRWYGRIALCLLTMTLLTAAFRPVGQFYLAWIGLVPWLLVLRSCRSQVGAFFWSWLAGVFFFSANLWWLYGVTAAGTPVLMGILGLYWGFTGLILRGAGLFDTDAPAVGWRDAVLKLRSPLLRIALTAVVFVSITEWLRGTWPWHGLPWLFLGHTQVPFGWICQIADLAGVTGLSLLIVAVNAWVATWIGHRLNVAGLIGSGITLIVLVIASVGYGFYRCQTEPARWTDGPRVLAVQPSFPQHNDGSKGATPEDFVNFHLSQTAKALSADPRVNLVAWSETVMPPLGTATYKQLFQARSLERALNSPVRAVPRSQIDWDPDNQAIDWITTRLAIRDLAVDHHTAVVTGALSVNFVESDDHKLKVAGKANVAYLIDRHGALDETAQVKIHLVPFGEYMPFRESFPPLFNLLLKFAPADLAEYEVTPGTEETIHHFAIDSPSGGEWHFTTPICFEDVDAGLCATMVRPLAGTPDGKQSDFLVNLTNDGWFAGPQNRQHFDIASFRAIENRVPLVRSVNTGISGFIDPLGRGFGELPARTEGTTVGQLPLDPRITLFTRTGPVVAEACAVLTAMLALVSLVATIARRFSRTDRDEAEPGRVAPGSGVPPAP